MKLGAATLDSFDEVWFADFEYRAPDGECPAVHCGVFRELRSGQTIRLFGDELAALHEAPFSIGPRTLFVSFFASAELGCFLSLGWPLPERILDLYVEFACITSGLTLPCGRGLLGALAYFGLDSIEAIEKETMRELAIRGAPFTAIERAELLAYCESDVVALAKLLPKMLPHIDLPRALLRARYMAAVARMEATGVPVDVAMLGSLRTHWKRIAGRLVAAVDVDFGVYVPTGQRTLDPTTAFGAAVVQAADEHGIDANQLAEAVDFVHHEERTARAEHLSAVQRVRQETGLTPAKIERWETTGGNDGRGRDHSTYPGWDVRSRELAARHPALGIGRGYVDGESFDDTDYGAALWSLLRELAPAATPKHHPDTILRAAKMVLDAASAFDPSSFASARPMSFSKARFAQWLSTNGIPWLQTETGDLSLADDTFREMSKAFPIVAPLRELRHALSELRLESLTVGRDGRNRCLLSPFKSKTGRNQPSNSKFIFGPSVWIRCLIKPTAGMAIAYLDWSQQEFGIAAALSGDQAMQEAYRTADPYLAFAKQAGAVPAHATKESHAQQREQFKACVLAVQYGMKEKSLAMRIGQSEAHARHLLQLHRETYSTFWKWSQAAIDHAMLHGYLYSVFGWRVHVGSDANARSLANFPMQANGAEMLRLACCLATERGIRVCAPIHDAILVEGPSDQIEAIVLAGQQAMREASEVVLSGFALRTDATVVRHPDRYVDKRGTAMWSKVMGILDELQAADDASSGWISNDPDEGQADVAPCSTPYCAGATLPVAPRHTRTVSSFCIY